MTKEVIYVGGDSFCDGNDILDLIRPARFYSHEEYKSLGQMKRQEISYQYNEYRRLQIDDVAIHNKLRWSAKLNELLDDYEVLNVSSRGGSSNQAIMYRAIIDIMELLKAGRKIKKVILQLTSPGRFMLFDPVEKTNDFKQQYNYRITNKLYNDFSESDMKVLYRNNFLNNLVYRDILYIYTAENAIMNLVGDQPVYVDSVFMYEEPDMWSEKEFNDESITNTAITFFKEQAERIKQQLLKCSMIHCITDDTEKVWTNNFHLNHVIHERFAKLIKDIYFNE